MAHGDDNGLRLPPNIAPLQVVIVPIYKDEAAKENVLSYCRDLRDRLAPAYRVKLDDRDSCTPGFKFNHWEVRGVPVRLEIGPKEAAANLVSVYRRDTGDKMATELDNLSDYLSQLMIDIQHNLFHQALSFAKDHIYRIESLDEIDDRPGWFEASWSEDPASEKLLKEKYSMVSRVLPADNENRPPKNKKCFITGGEAKHDWYFAKSY
jgi:prolyl-tRNA synthetase